MKKKHILLFGCGAAGLLFILFARISYYGVMALRAGYGSSDEQQLYLEKASAAGWQNG